MFHQQNETVKIIYLIYGYDEMSTEPLYHHAYRLSLTYSPP